MGWFLCLIFLVGYVITKVEVMLIAAGLFGIAGSISTLALNVKKEEK